MIGITLLLLFQGGRRSHSNSGVWREQKHTRTEHQKLATGATFIIYINIFQVRDIDSNQNKIRCREFVVVVVYI